MEVFNLKDNIFYLPNYELLVVNKNKIIKIWKVNYED